MTRLARSRSLIRVPIESQYYRVPILIGSRIINAWTNQYWPSSSKRVKVNICRWLTSRHQILYGCQISYCEWVTWVQQEKEEHGKIGQKWYLKKYLAHRLIILTCVVQNYYKLEYSTVQWQLYTHMRVPCMYRCTRVLWHAVRWGRGHFEHRLTIPYSNMQLRILQFIPFNSPGV